MFLTSSQYILRSIIAYPVPILAAPLVALLMKRMPRRPRMLGVWAVFARFGTVGGSWFFRVCFQLIGDRFVGLSALVAVGTDRLARLGR